MKLIPRIVPAISILLSASALAGADFAAHVPAQAPRTWVTPPLVDDLRAYCLDGAGAAPFQRMKADFDRDYLDEPFPDEPQTYGDPDPRKRTEEKVVFWRGAQDVTGRVSAIAGTAAVLWRVTGEQRYLDKAREFLLKACDWDEEGATGIYYNDEANFRLFRVLPEVYDQIRSELTPAERAKASAHLRARGILTIRWIKEAKVESLERNAVRNEPKSHPVRFMAMAGQAGLALWDDVPEAREWYAFAYNWYHDIFTPWGGADGGWAEGVAYWRGVYEHAVFQDALLLIGDPIAYQTPFWKNTGYFQVYFVQPYYTTSFGDVSNQGRFNMEPGVYDFLRHLARVQQNGYYLSWTNLYQDTRPLPADKGLGELSRIYPTAVEYLLRDFIASTIPMPQAEPLAQLPQARHFKDIGWVSMHSALGDPGEDIQVSFKSSPYGSFSHSHADQNAFVLNAYGQPLAINAGYREHHRSEMHKYFVWQTASKNAVLINTRGQEIQDKGATGKITRFETAPRYVLATGDATVAYNTLQKNRSEVKAALRDVVFVDSRYVIVRDHVTLKDPGRIDWLLHAYNTIEYDVYDGQVDIQKAGVYLFGQLRVRDNVLRMQVNNEFPVPVVERYRDPEWVAQEGYLTSQALDQSHFSAYTTRESDDHEVYAVLWPSRDETERAKLQVTLIDGGIRVHRPDGKVDTVLLDDNRLSVE